MSIVQIILTMIGAALAGALFSMLRFQTACGIYLLCMISMLYFAYRIEFLSAHRQASTEKSHGEKFQGLKIKMTYGCLLVVFILIPVAIGLKLF